MIRASLRQVFYLLLRLQLASHLELASTKIPKTPMNERIGEITKNKLILVI
jgi:hypothetical protein